MAGKPLAGVAVCGFKVALAKVVAFLKAKIDPGYGTASVKCRRPTLNYLSQMENVCPNVHNDVPKALIKLMWTFVHTLSYLPLQDEGGEHCNLLHSAIPAQFFRA